MSRARPLPSRPMRVLHFRRIFSQLSESFIYNPLIEMQSRGVDVHMLCVLRVAARDRPFPSRQLFDSPRAMQSPKLMGRADASNAGQVQIDRLIWPLLRRSLEKRLDAVDPDVVLAHFGPDGCLISPSARKRGIPVAVMFYGYEVSRLMHAAGRFWGPRMQHLFNEAHLLIAISNHIAERLVQLGADEKKIRLVHLGTPLDRFTYRDPAADYDGGTVRCIHVGRLTAKKSPVHLLRAFAKSREILQGKAELQLDIVGDGELRADTLQQVERLDLGDHVILHGAQPHQRVAELLGQGHIYTQHCMTAPNGDMEGLGVTFVEASARGLPVITTRHNGIPDVVLHEQTGLLSPEGDVDAMAGNIIDLATDPQRWTTLGRAGRAHVEQGFSLDHSVDRMLELLESIARKR